MALSLNSGLFRTKTFWGGLATILTGIGIIVAGDIPTGLQTVGLGVLAILGRDALVSSAK